MQIICKPTPSKVALLRTISFTLFLCALCIRTASAQSSGTSSSGVDTSQLADAALKGVGIRIRIASGLESGRVIVVLDSAFVDGKKRVETEALLQRAAVARSASATPVHYRVALQSFESLTDSTAKVIVTLATRATAGCDNKTFAVLLVKRAGAWRSNLIVEVVAVGCKNSR